MKVFMKTDSGRQWGSMHMVVGPDRVDGYGDHYVYVDRILVSFGDWSETTYPVKGEEVYVYGPSFNFTLEEAYRKVVQMVFDGRFEYYGNRRFTIYDL